MKGLVEAGRIALRRAATSSAVDDYPLHVIAEGRSAAAVTARHRRRCGASHWRSLAAVEIENTIAKVIRAQPFPPLNSVLGPAGERWTPVHGLAPLSQAAAVFEDMVQARVRRNGRRASTRVGVQHRAICSRSLSTNALIVEPVFYWPGAPDADPCGRRWNPRSPGASCRCCPTSPEAHGRGGGRHVPTRATRSSSAHRLRRTSRSGAPTPTAPAATRRRGQLDRSALKQRGRSHSAP